METEFRAQYMDMRSKVQDFAAVLLDYTRSSEELEIMLNYGPNYSDLSEGCKHTLERLKLAIKYKQKAVRAGLRWEVMTFW